jgi:hypothetical protein
MGVRGIARGGGGGVGREADVELRTGSSTALSPIRRSVIRSVRGSRTFLA